MRVDDGCDTRRERVTVRPEQPVACRGGEVGTRMRRRRQLQMLTGKPAAAGMRMGDPGDDDDEQRAEAGEARATTTGSRPRVTRQGNHDRAERKYDARQSAKILKRRQRVLRGGGSEDDDDDEDNNDETEV